MTYSDVPTRPNAPVLTPPRVPSWQDTNTWCESCEIHRATVNRPLCPICLDKREESQR